MPPLGRGLEDVCAVHAHSGVSASVRSPGPQPSPVAQGPGFGGIANTLKMNACSWPRPEQGGDLGSEEITRDAWQPCPESGSEGLPRVPPLTYHPHPSP